MYMWIFQYKLWNKKLQVTERYCSLQYWYLAVKNSCILTMVKISIGYTWNYKHEIGNEQIIMVSAHILHEATVLGANAKPYGFIS